MFNLFKKDKVAKNKPNFKTQIRSQKSGIELINFIMKRIGLISLFVFLPALFLITLFAIIAMAIIWFIPHSQAGNNLTTFFASSLHLNLVGSFWESVINSIMAVLYLIFIHPIIWINSSLQTIIIFVGSGNLSNSLFNGSKNTLFWIIFGVASVLLIVTLSIKAIEWMQNRNMASVKSTTKNALLVMVGICLIPLIFLMINLIMVSVAKIFIDNISQNQDLSLAIFNSSFTDGLHHFTYIPDSWSFSDSGNFSYFICLVAEGFLAYILLLITIQLFFQVYELFVLYCLSPWVFFNSITDEARKFQNWKEAVIWRAMAFSLLFLAFNIFLMAIPIVSEISTAVPSSIAQPVFVLVGILALGLVVVKFPLLLNTILGGKTSLSDAMGNFAGLRMATAGVMGATALGFSSLKTGAKLGWKGVKGFNRGIGSLRAIKQAKNIGLIPTSKFGVGFGTSALIANFRNENNKGYSKTAKAINKVKKPDFEKPKFEKPDFENLKPLDYKNFVSEKQLNNFVKNRKKLSNTELDKLWAKKIENYYIKQKTGVDPEAKKGFSKNSKGSNDWILNHWNWGNLSEKEEKEARTWYQKKIDIKQNWVGDTQDEFISHMKNKWKEIYEGD